MRKMFISLLLFAVLLGRFTSIAAQSPIPLEVFVHHDRPNQVATVYFTNPISGLSTPVTIQNVRQEVLVTDEMLLTGLGVMFRDPSSGRVLLAAPSGQITPHPFIPQQPSGLLDVDWVLSPDGASIAWVEVFVQGNSVISVPYVADLKGTTITPLPPPPPSPPLRRMMPLALTNDRSLFFYDAAFPTGPRSLTDFFVGYEDVHVFVANRQTYQQLPNEPSCLCGAGVGGNGRIFLRLSEAAQGFDLHWWNLDSNSDTPIPSVALRFGEAGDFFVPENFPFAFYAQAQNLQDDSPEAQFALMRVDLTAHTQKVLIGPSVQRFKVMALRDEGRELILVDVYGGATYKFDLTTDELALVSEDTWLGTFYLQ